MARQKLSVEERRRRNREYQKKRRVKIHSEAELKEEYLRKERQRWKKRVEEGKIKNINDLNEREREVRERLGNIDNRHVPDVFCGIYTECFLYFETFQFMEIRL